MLEKGGYQVYVASLVEEKVYKSRNRYQKETNVIPGKVFVRTVEEKLMPQTIGPNRRFCIGKPHQVGERLCRKVKKSTFEYPKIRTRVGPRREKIPPENKYFTIFFAEKFCYMENCLYFCSRFQTRN